MKLIDLRSDTVTKPDKNIIEEALLAELGDDEYGEDPTVNNLQEKCAELLGFESGLFVSSGLMGNQISLLIHNSPGTEVITTSDSHIKNYEHGAASFLSRVQFREIDHKDGALNLDSIKSVYEKSKVHKPQIKTIAQENTHLASGGSIVSYSHLAEVYSFAKEKGINVGRIISIKNKSLLAMMKIEFAESKLKSNKHIESDDGILLDFAI